MSMLSSQCTERRERGIKRGNEFLLLGEASFGRKTLNAGLSSVRRTALTSERSLFPRTLPRPLAAVGLLLAALPALAAPAPVKPTDAIIINSGSTNTTGYIVIVSPDGTVHYKFGVAANSTETRYIAAALPKAQTKKLFHDLAAAMPLKALPVHHGMRSASFGTQTVMTYKGQRSPDLSSATDPRTVVLKADIDAITKALHIGNVPRRSIVIEKYPARLNGAKN